MAEQNYLFHIRYLPTLDYLETIRNGYMILGKVSILVVGLDNAGKTTISKTLLKLPINAVAPTVGYSSDEFKFRHYLVTMIDVGGGQRIRAIWKNYFAEVHGVIYVVDAADRERIHESKEELERLLSNDLVSGKPVLLLANKQDQAGALDEVDVSQQLNLEAIVNEYKCLCKVEMTSAIKGRKDPAISNGVTWLLSAVEQDYIKLSHRVGKDVQERDLQIEEEMAAKRERIRLRKEQAAAEEENGDNGSEASMRSRLSVALTMPRDDVTGDTPSPDRTVHSGLGDEIMDDLESEEEINIPGSIPELRGAATFQMRRVSTPRRTPDNRTNQSQTPRTPDQTPQSPHPSPGLPTPQVIDTSWSFANGAAETGDFDVPLANMNGNGKASHNKVAPFNPAVGKFPLPGTVHPSKKLAPLSNPPQTTDSDVNKDLPKLPPLLLRPNVDPDDDVVM